MEIISIPIEAVEPDPGQPRTNFDPEKLHELAESMRTEGYWQHKPVHVRENFDEPGKFVLVHGERRLRAARKAGLREISAIVLTYSNDENGARQLFLDQYLDNAMRDNFDSIEDIKAIHKAITELGATVALIAKRTGKSQAAIKADLPLATLPPVVQKAVDNGTCPKVVAREIAKFPDNKVLTAFKWATKNMRSAKTMLAGVAAYQKEIGQGTLDFSLVAKDAKDTGDLRIAKDLWERFSKQFGKFSKFADTQHATIVVAKNRQINELEATADAMRKIAEKILHDCLAYRAQKGEQLAKAA